VKRHAVALGWLAAVAATQAFPSWHRQIADGFASDVRSYTAIARAAPSFPSVHLAAQHAQRWLPNWLAGSLATATHVPLHDVYRTLTLLCLVVVLAAVDHAVSRRGATTGGRVVALGLVAASAYTVRYEVAAPGMLADAAFLAAFAVALAALGDERWWLLVTALAAAVAARQTAVPVAIVAALLVARRSRIAAAATLAVPAGVFFGVVAAASSFSQRTGGAVTVIHALGQPRTFAAHVGRTLLPLLMPLTVLVAASVRSRARPALDALALAAVVAVQPLALAPAWVASNESRLAGLALPALAVAAAPVLGRLDRRTVALVACAELIASLHARYSDVGIPSNRVWGALVVLSMAIATAALLRSRTQDATPGSTRPRSASGRHLRRAS
jgi:hypothetical protein